MGEEARLEGEDLRRRESQLALKGPEPHDLGRRGEKVSHPGDDRRGGDAPPLGLLGRKPDEVPFGEVALVAGDAGK